MTVPFYLLLWLAYYALHSLLAAEGVKAALCRIVPQRYYRLGYNLVAAGLLAALVFLYFLVEKTALWEPNWSAPIAGTVLLLFGISWVVRAMKRYDLVEFTGLGQLRSGQNLTPGKLQTRGPNGRVRHPLYFGTLLVLWGVLLLLPTDAMLGVALLSTIYLVIGSRLEEGKLVAQFGEAYRKYQREVPMLLPYRWRRSKLKW